MLISCQCVMARMSLSLRKEQSVNFTQHVLKNVDSSLKGSNIVDFAEEICRTIQLQIIAIF